MFQRALWQEALEPVYQDWVTKYADELPTEEILASAMELSELYVELRPLYELRDRLADFVRELASMVE